MKENFENWLNDNSITEVECLVPDLGGIARGKILPTNKFIKGLNDDSHRLPQSIFIQTISGGYATEGMGSFGYFMGALCFGYGAYSLNKAFKSDYSSD